jgi:cytochrome c peroxidase
MDPENENYALYRKLFRKVYGVKFNQVDLSDPVTVEAMYHMVADAIAEFEKSKVFRRFTSKFDYFLAGAVELTDQEMHGLELFEGAALCSACHVTDPVIMPDGTEMPPVFTDFTYDNLGIPKSDNPLIADQPVDFGLGGRPDIAAVDPLGEQLGKFKVSSLRNIAITPPYGHNGFFATLEEIVHFYNTRDVEPWPAPEVPQNVNSDELGDLGLTAEEEAALVAFLRTLTDGYPRPQPPTPMSSVPSSGTNYLAQQ